MTLHVDVKQCDGCFRVIEIKHHCVSIPNIFDFEMNICVNLCSGCSSLLDWFVYQYIELYEQQAKKLEDKKFSLTKKTSRSMR